MTPPPPPDPPIELWLALSIALLLFLYRIYLLIPFTAEHFIYFCGKDGFVNPTSASTKLLNCWFPHQFDPWGFFLDGLGVRREGNVVHPGGFLAVQPPRGFLHPQESMFPSAQKAKRRNHSSTNIQNMHMSSTSREHNWEDQVEDSQLREQRKAS